MKSAQALIAAALAVASPAHAEDIVGRASVIDGDTIEIAGQKIRFNGIDAPESWQRCEDAAGQEYRCGKEAAEALDTFLAASRPTICRQLGHDRYKRVIAECHRIDGRDVNTWMVAHGHALDWSKYSKGFYASSQQIAKAGKLGVWRGAFTVPCEARAERNKREAKC